MERNTKKAQELEQEFVPYTMVYNEMKQKKKQLPITLFFRKKDEYFSFVLTNTICVFIYVG
jgi:hypothetical protein